MKPVIWGLGRSGRGSAAGSAVAYCIGITNVDPIKYDLLFERFLNPERVSMPDIDIDFDDEGRDKIIKWVVEKYGKLRYRLSYSVLGGKSAIKDAGRVLDVPIPDTNNIAKLIPPSPGMNIAKALAKYDKLKPEEQMLVDEMRYVLDSPDDPVTEFWQVPKRWKAVSGIQESMPVGLSLHRKM
jgi:DNA polymerase-3 subunit alpha